MFELTRPCFFSAEGDSQRVEVLRSPLVKSTWGPYAPVRKFIEDNGLVLLSRETAESRDWMCGAVETWVFVTPSARNELYAAVPV